MGGLRSRVEGRWAVGERLSGEGGWGRRGEQAGRKATDATTRRRVRKQNKGPKGGKGGGGKGGGRGKVDEPYGTIEGREGRLVSIHPSSSELEEGGEKQAKKVRGEGGR